MCPATVATSTSSSAVRYGYQRKSFYAEGLFWVFYSDGTNAGWEHSHNGVDWAEAFTSIGACTSGFYFSIWFDGTYVHYARSNNFDLFYRRGTPVNDGTINWSVEQTVYDGSSGDEYKFPCICVDTNGYAWIGINHDKPDGDDFPVVLKNDNNDGTWVTDFAYELSAVDHSLWRACPIPLTNGKVYVIYCRSAAAPLGNLWNGAAWVGEENDLADFNIEDGYGFSAVAVGDNVHFVYNRDVTYQIRHNERVWGVGWDAVDVLVQDNLFGDTAPALSVDPSTGDLYCFWTNNDVDHVFYKKYSSGSWDVDPTDWIDESADGMQYDYLISSFYTDYGGYIGLLYITLLVSPYNVRFAFLDLNPPSTTSTSTTSTSTTSTSTSTTSTSTSTSTSTTAPPCTYEICLAVDGFDATMDSWTRVGNAPYLDSWDGNLWSNIVKTNWDPAKTGDFSFENTAQSGYPTNVDIQIHARLEIIGNDIFEVWMWESVGGWEKVGEVTPTKFSVIHTIDIISKFDTFAKINEAKLRLRYVKM